ncbi:hypothetical protein, variant [Exophiala mesophila]|uniref:Uncharacterized protein n=1 Tax=Exophiala mesophila TaxID=212818 RepID=A0A0D1WK96_EXOME|nr:hypothetical protein, variant [Exophiala mesophila]KIV89365.1 hypothetical protein, variant [Exophiala mesophila]
MTKRKPLPSRAYDTFPSDSASQPPGPDTETPSTTSYHGADSDKSRSAAAEARRLGSMGSWGDRFSGGTPSTDPTPDVSTIDEEDNGLQSDVRYPLPPKDQDQDQDPSDPPPMYTPAATSSTVPSPEITRATLVNHDRKSGDTEVPTVGNAGPGPSTNDTWGPTREIVHRETSHSITGSFKLYDLLDLSTKSGSISITVEVQPGEKPAHMRLSTSSGSINVRVVQFEGAGRWLSWASSKIAKPVEGLNSLDRMFVTEISTNSGSVNGNVLHGNGGTTSISTSSGSINLSFYVVGVSSGDPTSKITTNSKSGSQNIKVIPYARFADSYSEQASTSAIRAMQNLHRISGSGSITVKYPSEWEGRLHIEQTGSGSMMAGGAGLNVDRREPKELWAWKGESPSDAPVVEIRELGSGSIHFQV